MVTTPLHPKIIRCSDCLTLLGPDLAILGFDYFLCMPCYDKLDDE